MKKIKTTIGLLILFLSLCVQAGTVGDAIEITIKVAPNVLNILNQGEVVTVHTDISYNAVVGASVTLNGVEIDWWKSDDRGNFVAKFVMSEIKDLPLEIGGMNTLTLSGTTKLGIDFTGSQDIKVIQVVPAKN